ncbi:MAG TPA: isoprenylcysteine carboxylmethyltransferase family protein [Bacteroidales bacterium]|nr:isoprenylcysteine carboxylmethyltransferase family protein [Bacteroidales bacterium]
MIETSSTNNSDSKMVKIGSFFFHIRNYLFPFFYLILFLPSPRIFNSFYTPLILGLLILFCGLLIRQLTIGFVNINRAGKNKQVHADILHTDGLFSHCRNPLYLGNVIEILGLAILSNSLIFLLIIFPIFVFIYQSIIIAEEDYLYKKFGQEYLEYKKRVPRWLANIKGIKKTFHSMNFNYKRVLLKEYTTTFIALLAATLLIMKLYYYFYPNTFRSSLPYFMLLIALLIIAYFIIRYLKKSHKLTS